MKSLLIIDAKLFLLIAIIAIRTNSASCLSVLNESSFPGQADFVHSLPNVSLPFVQNYSSIGHYSGFLKPSFQGVDILIPYWFFKSQSPNWQIEPLLLWLGNYVSTFNFALTGISPIRMNKNGTLSVNQFAWNKKANILFFDPFPGVGFLYEQPHEFVQNDTGVAKFTFDTLERFFKKFPQLENNEFYICGEGYGSFHTGVLAKKLVEKKYPKNFKGVVIGNGVFNMYDAVNAHFQFVHKMKRNLYNQTFWQNLDNLCCPRKPCSHLSTAEGECTFQECQTFTYDELNLNSQSDCSKFYKTFLRNLIENFKHEKKLLDLHNIHEKCVLGVENATCRRYIITKKIYNWFNLNSDAVREALHIKDDDVYTWLPGNNGYHRHLMRQYPTLHGHVMFLLRNNIRVLLYTGYEDGIASPYNTKWLLNDLPIHPLLDSERDFLVDAKKVGYKTRFCKGLIYYGITDAGHTPAEDKAGSVLEMLNEFVFGDHSANSASNWDAVCPQTVSDCTKYCSTDPTPEIEDAFSNFWVESLNRYYMDYLQFRFEYDPSTRESVLVLY